jgi:hypothetical protein
MARVMAALLFFVIGSVEAGAQSGWEYLDQTPERIIGLLDLPDIVGSGCGTLEKPGTARIFRAPSQDKPHVGTIYMRDEGNAGCGLTIDTVGGTKEDVPTLESGYEIGAAIVFERRGPWFRVRLARGFGWIRRNNSKDFLSYPEILREKLAYILQVWDGTLRASPGPSGRVIPLPPEWQALIERQIDIEFMGSQRAGNDLWIHVRLVTERCGQSVEGVPQPVTGWIPAYRSNRAPTAWFFSRGC